MGQHGIESFISQGADGRYRHAWRDRIELRLVGAGIIEVGLGQQQHRSGSALVSDDEQSFEPAKIEVLAKGGRKKDDVDIGGKHLFLDLRVGSLADDGTGSRQEMFDHEHLAGALSVAQPVVARAASANARSRRGEGTTSATLPQLAQTMWW